MNVKGLVWVGVATAQYPAAVEFFSTVLGLRVEFDEGTTVELSTANGDRVQLFAPGDEYFEFFCDVGARVVPLFEVDNLDLARAELDRAGVEVIGEPRSDSTWRWIHLRGPDGNVYTLAERRSHPISSARP